MLLYVSHIFTLVCLYTTQWRPQHAGGSRGGTPGGSGARVGGSSNSHGHGRFSSPQRNAAPGTPSPQSRIDRLATPKHVLLLEGDGRLLEREQ